MKRKGTNGIPSLDGAESFRFAPRVRARCNVNETFTGVTIEPGVEEAERLLALGNHEVIQKRNNACHGLYVGDQPHAPGKIRSVRRQGEGKGIDDAECKEVGLRVGKDALGLSSSCRSRYE